jgi:hypothetical protein
MAQLNSSTFFEKFSKPDKAHPKYREMAWWWRFAEISYLGDPLWSSPDISITHWWPVVSTNAQTQEQTVHRQPEYIFSMLWPFRSEEPNDYWLRKQQAVRVNMTRPILDLYTNHVFSKAINRDSGSAPVLDTFWEDVDMRGNGIDDWMAHGITQAQIFGHVFAVVDMTGAQGASEVRHMADQQELNVRPFAQWFSPLRVPGWAVDRQGNFLWVQVVEDDPRFQRVTPDTPEEHPLVVRTWYPDHWEMQGKGDTFRCPFCNREGVIGAGLNPLGRVPVEVLYRKRRSDTVDPIGVSMAEPIAKLDREIYNLMSHLQSMQYEQAFPFLAFPDPSGKLGTMNLGITRAFAYNPTDGGAPPSFVAPPADTARLIAEQIAEKMEQIRAISGLSRGNAEKSIASRSGAALLIETSDRAAMLSSLASHAEDFEIRLSDLAAQTMQQGTETTTVKYPDRYDVTRLGDDLEEIDRFFALDPVPAAKAETMKQLQARLLSHLPADRLEEIQKETLEKAKAKEDKKPNGKAEEVHEEGQEISEEEAIEEVEEEGEEAEAKGPEVEKKEAPPFGR